MENDLLNAVRSEVCFLPGAVLPPPPFPPPRASFALSISLFFGQLSAIINLNILLSLV